MNALMDDPRTADAGIDAANDRGMITLTGTVDSEEARRAAEEIARDQVGVLTVVNELKVK
jgi:osmotically-inducible protein OsmY